MQGEKWGQTLSNAENVSEGSGNDKELVPPFISSSKGARPIGVTTTDKSALQEIDFCFLVGLFVEKQTRETIHVARTWTHTQKKHNVEPTPVAPL